MAVVMLPSLTTELVPEAIATASSLTDRATAEAVATLALSITVRYVGIASAAKILSTTKATTSSRSVKPRRVRFEDFFRTEVGIYKTVCSVGGWGQRFRVPDVI
jgi:hypothetical protein